MVYLVGDMGNKLIAKVTVGVGTALFAIIHASHVFEGGILNPISPSLFWLIRTLQSTANIEST